MNSLNRVMLILLLLFFSLGITLCYAKNNQGFEYVVTDYSKDDLIFISAIGSEQDGVTCTWEISPAVLASCKMYTITSLVKSIDFNHLIEIASNFVDTHYGGMWKNKLHFISLGYQTINDQKFGKDKKVERNDWIIMVNFRDEKDNENEINETVFMLPDGRIIVSSNNFEEVDTI